MDHLIKDFSESAYFEICKKQATYVHIARTYWYIFLCGKFSSMRMHSMLIKTEHAALLVVATGIFKPIEMNSNTQNVYIIHHDKHFVLENNPNSNLLHA